MRFLQGDAQALPFPTDHFDVVSVGFGLRNVQDPRRGLAEFVRVARPGGRVAVLEVMTMTPAIANQIRSNDVNKINDVIQTSRHLGMFRLDDHLQQLVQDGRIEAADAVAFAQDPPALQERLVS